MNCIFTVATEGFIQTNALASIRAAKERWQCGFGILKKSESPLHPACWKTEALERASVQGYEKVFILDADVVVNSTCPSPFNWPDDVFATVSDRESGCHKRDPVEASELNALGVETLSYYFNSGVMLASVNHHRAMFAEAAELCRKFPALQWHDQTPFNVAAKNASVINFRLFETWNFANVERLDDWQNMKKNIYHFCGNGDRDKLIEEVKWKG